MIAAFESAMTDWRATSAIQLPLDWVSTWDAQMRLHVLRLLSGWRGAEVIILMNTSVRSVRTVGEIAVHLMDLAVALLSTQATVKLILDVPEPENPGKKFLSKLSTTIRRRWANAVGLDMGDILVPSLEGVDLRDDTPRRAGDTLTPEAGKYHLAQVQDLFLRRGLRRPTPTRRASPARTSPGAGSPSTWLSEGSQGEPTVVTLQPPRPPTVTPLADWKAEGLNPAVNHLTGRPVPPCPGPSRDQPGTKRKPQVTHSSTTPGSKKPTLYDITTNALAEVSQLQYLLGQHQPDLVMLEERVQRMVSLEVNDKLCALGVRIAMLETCVGRAGGYQYARTSPGEGDVEEDLYASAIDLTLMPASPADDLRNSLTPEPTDPFHDMDVCLDGAPEDEEELILLEEDDNERLLGTPVQDEPEALVGRLEAAVGEGEVPAGARSTKRENM